VVVEVEVQQLVEEVRVAQPARYEFQLVHGFLLGVSSSSLGGLLVPD
jgi:hypothetical protein